MYFTRLEIPDFPVLRVFNLRVRITECSEHVNSFIDVYWAYVRKKNASLENPKVPLTSKFFIVLFGRTFKMIE